MKITGIIPARMNSVRFPGKALADILGTPMVVRVWNAAEESGVFESVFVATDSAEIASVCQAQKIPVLMTSSHHQNPTSRTAEAATILNADLYAMIGGDEPLLSPEDIRLVVSKGSAALSDKTAAPFVVNAMAPVSSAAEAADPSNIKLQYNELCEMITASRSLFSANEDSDTVLTDSPALPKPRCHKFVSIGVYTKKALDYFTSTPPGPLELSEHFDLLRFTEHGKKVLLVEMSGRTLSVDTPTDLETVKELLNAKKEKLTIETTF